VSNDEFKKMLNAKVKDLVREMPKDLWSDKS